MWEHSLCTFYKNHYDTVGTPVTLRDVLYWLFHSGLDTIIELRNLDHTAADYDKRKKSLKDTLPLFSPSALLASRETGNIQITSRTGLVSFDFDHCHEFDLDELKQAIFSLPFVAWVGLSCSGHGIYALVLIAEPERQREYVEHCFQVFKEYGLPIDTSKGRNVNDLRYVSYDSRPLFRDDPQPLRIKHFKPQQQPKKGIVKRDTLTTSNNSGLVNDAVKEISSAQVGQRWQTVQKWAFTLGGLNDQELISTIKNAISGNSAFVGVEDKYIRCAVDCFAAGGLKPLPV